MRGAALVHINPLIEAASRRTIVPHEMADMATFRTTKVGTMTVQVRIGGDMALLRGVAKAVFEAAADPAVLDGEFLESYTHGLEEYRALCEATPWSELVRGSGVDEAAIRALADSYLNSGRVIIAWCLGVTQHEHGVDTVREIVNLMLLRGNIGREGAGPCPVRGHSNVQGNRTFGINHRPDQQFLDRLAEVCHIDPPREHGLDVARAIEAMHEGTVKVFVSLGGNLALAAPVHISHGMKEPVSADLRSDCAILAGMAQATLPGSGTPWQRYAEDYDRIRDTMAQVFDGLEDFNTRVRHPHGFRVTQPARMRGFLTPSGRAEFGLAPLPGDTDPAEGRLMLATVRSHDQFNTTIYSNDDRYRGLKGLRTVVFMNSGDMKDRGLGEFNLVDITSFSRDGSRRTVYGYRDIRYEIPRGCAAGYMPELNVLCGIADYSTQGGQPVTKHLEVEVTRARATGAGQ